jgi:hypothetical protein
MRPSPDYGWHCIGMGGNNCDELTQLTMSQSGFAKSVITWMCSKHLGGRKLARMLRARNMLEIVLGALVVIGVFVFWCDVTDSWNKVLNKTGRR